MCDRRQLQTPQVKRLHRHFTECRSVVQDGVITDLKVDQPGRLEVSAAEEVLKGL